MHCVVYISVINVSIIPKFMYKVCNKLLGVGVNLTQIFYLYCIHHVNK